VPGCAAEVAIEQGVGRFGFARDAGLACGVVNFSDFSVAGGVGADLPAGLHQPAELGPIHERFFHHPFRVGAHGLGLVPGSGLDTVGDREAGAGESKRSQLRQGNGERVEPAVVEVQCDGPGRQRRALDELIDDLGRGNHGPVMVGKIAQVAAEFVFAEDAGGGVERRPAQLRVVFGIDVVVDEDG